MPVEQCLPAENTHYDLGRQSMIRRREFGKATGVQEFAGVGFFALDLQKNFESRGASWRDGHRDYSDMPCVLPCPGLLSESRKVDSRRKSREGRLKFFTHTIQAGY